MQLNLSHNFFNENPHQLLTHGDIKITAFRYSTGTEALKIENTKGFFVILPFQGQQIWQANFLGKELGMLTSIKEPIPNVEYLKTYGGFLLHCGISAFGSPQADDSHPLHGETPNISFNEAYIDCSEDENGKFVTISGLLNFDIAFTRHYHFIPSCKLYENDSILHFNLTIKNLRTEPMEYMYLAHINFRPINGAKLIYSAHRDAAHIKVHKRIAANVPKQQAEKLMAFMERIQENPSLVDYVGNKDEIYDPEICFAIKYEGDENNRAYTLQYEAGVGACYVSHPIDVLPVGVRWISRTGSEDSMGMVLPATAEHLGYMNAKRANMVKSLDGGEILTFSYEVGYIDDAQALEVIDKINTILK